MTRIFISHSNSDKAIAYKLVNFLLAALRLEEEEIFCSSNPDQGLSFSAFAITDQLKNQLKNSEALIVLITADSLHSAWIPFEAGSFWTTDKKIIPILGPGLTHDDLQGPLKSLLSISIDAEDCKYKVNNAINQLVKRLKIEQKFSKRRDDTLQEFFEALRAWESKRPVPVSQEEVEHLKTQIQELERSHTQQLEELEQSYQTQIAEKESEINRLQRQIKQLQVVVELKSERGVDYTKLRDLLAGGKWKEADEEIGKVMCQAVGREGGWLDEENINKFPCQDLRTINQLWLHYSDGKFGFSVQKEIYERMVKEQEWTDLKEQEWQNFIVHIGWRKRRRYLSYSELTFNLEAPTAHLPKYVLLKAEEEQRLVQCLSSLAQRLVTCQP